MVCLGLLYEWRVVSWPQFFGWIEGWSNIIHKVWNIYAIYIVTKDGNIIYNVGDDSLFVLFFTWRERERE